MTANRRQALRALRRAVFFAGLAGVALADPANAFSFGRDSVQKPASQEFGLGPRESAKQMYTVFMRPTEVVRLRKLQTIRVLVLDAMGRPVEDASISVDGAMPEHGHGLPTRPQVGRSLGGGMYDIEGLRFSMGGWWQLKLSIDTPAGSDRVTFNLAL